jgi:hypothetical protein
MMDETEAEEAQTEVTADYIARVVAARAPEVADHIVPYEIFIQLLEVIDAMAERVAELGTRVEGWTEEAA